MSNLTFQLSTVSKENERMLQDTLYAGAKNSKENRHTCRAGVPPKTGSSLSRLVHTSARSSPITAFTYDTRIQMFLCTTNIERAFQSFRKIFYTRYALKSDFPQLYVKRVAYNCDCKIVSVKLCVHAYM